MTTLTTEMMHKMIAELRGKFTEPAISAILFTDKSDCIQPGNFFQADHEDKRYILCHKRDVDRIAASVTSKPSEKPYQVGILHHFAGIPVIEDDEKIKEIFEDAARRMYEKFMEDALKPRPFDFEKVDISFRYTFRSW